MPYLLKPKVPGIIRPMNVSVRTIGVKTEIELQKCTQENKPTIDPYSIKGRCIPGSSNKLVSARFPLRLDQIITSGRRREMREHHRSIPIKTQLSDPRAIGSVRECETRSELITILPIPCLDVDLVPLFRPHEECPPV